MRIGLSTHNTATSVRIDVVARALEERGFESLFVGEHPHVPSARVTPYPSGTDHPPPYERELDPLVSLATAATATTTLLLGTAVCLALEHDLFDLAKTVASVDVLSGGRVLLGVGSGWNPEELANCRPDIPWSARYRALSECVLALKQLWTAQEAEFHGEFFDFDPVWSAPKPVQRPHPPVLAALGGRVGSSHAMAWADGWLPLSAVLGPEQKKIPRFRELAQEAGRGDLPISVLLPPDPPADLAPMVANLVALDVHRFVFTSPPEIEHDRDALLRYVDGCVAVAQQAG